MLLLPLYTFMAWTEQLYLYLANKNFRYLFIIYEICESLSVLRCCKKLHSILRVDILCMDHTAFSCHGQVDTYGYVLRSGSD
jgi:hypothetical protein